jgi:hypothetical protein
MDFDENGAFDIGEMLHRDLTRALFFVISAP